jgi:hypothetical protein
MYTDTSGGPMLYSTLHILPWLVAVVAVIG